MKTIDLKSLLLGVLLSMIGLVISLVATSSRVPVAWEHKVVIVEGQGSEWVYGRKLSGVSKDGWEIEGIAKENQHSLLVALRRATNAHGASWWTRWKSWKQ